MKSILFAPNVSWIAHRGLSHLYIENSLDAFYAAARLPFFGIETDVHLTLDDVIVCHHDDHIERLTGQKRYIEKMTFAELSRYRLLNSNQSIPTFKDYLNVCKSHQKVSIIELKAPLSDWKIKKILDEAIKHYDLNQCIFISFYLDNLVMLRKLSKDVSIQFLTTEINPLIVELCKSHHFDLNLDHILLDKDLVDSLHKSHLKVNCWTIRNAFDAEKYVNMNVDFITTDGF